MREMAIVADTVTFNSDGLSLSSGWNFGHSSATGFDVNAEFAFFFPSVRVVA